MATKVLNGEILTGPQDFVGQSAPSVSGSGNGRLYFDSGSEIFKVSQNAGAFVPLIQSSAFSVIDAFTYSSFGGV